MIDNLASFIEVPGWADTIWLTKQKRVDRDFALFGDASFDIVKDLTLSGGLRYFRYNNTLVGFFGYSDNFSSYTGVAGCIGPATTDGAPCTNLGMLDSNGNVVPRQAKDDGFIHRLNLTWHVSPDHMVYATWSRGFRPGGTNRRGGLYGYKADFLTNYEVGFKTSWANGKLRWNAALFQLDWKNFQFSILGPNGLTEIRNAAQARIRGFESDVYWRPVHDLTFTAGISILDPKLTANYCGYTDDAGNPVTDCADPLAPSGTRLPASSRFKGNVTARYLFPISNDWEGHVQLAAVYQSSVRSNLLLEDNRLIGTMRSYGTVDLSVGGETMDKGWSAEVYITNLFDKRGETYRYAQCGASICANDSADTPGNVYSVPNKPRTFGLRVGRSF